MAWWWWGNNSSASNFDTSISCDVGATIGGHGVSAGGITYVTAPVPAVPVMTEEQIEELHRQIADYATICKRHAEMLEQSRMAGMSLGNLCSNTLLASGGNKITVRHRWSPTAGQLKILERIFEQENGSQIKAKLKQITSELAQHGKISEANVHNWFQNRKARSKRKQMVLSSNTESEVEVEAETSIGKRVKSDKTHSDEDQPPRREENSSPNPEVVSELHAKYQETQSTLLSNGSSKNPGSTRPIGQTSSSCEKTSNPSMNQSRDRSYGLSWGPYFVPPIGQ